MGKSATIGSLGIDLGLNTARFKDGMTKAGKSMDRFKAKSIKSLKAAGREFKQFSKLAAAAATGLAFAVGKAVSSLDDLDKQARRGGLNVEVFQKWQFAAEKAGVANNSFALAMQRANRRIGEAAQGFGSAKATLDRLNVSVIDSDGNVRSTESVFRDFADAVSKIEDPGRKAAAMMALVDSEGVGLMLAVEGGNKQLLAMERRAESLGIVLRKETIKQAVELKDQFAELASIASTRTTVALANLFPVVLDLTNSFIAAIPKVVQFTRTISDLMNNTEGAKLSKRISQFKDDIERSKKTIEDLKNPSFLGKVNEQGLLTTLLFGSDSNEADQKGIARLEAGIRGREALIKESRDRLKELFKEGLLPNSKPKFLTGDDLPETGARTQPSLGSSELLKKTLEDELNSIRQFAKSQEQILQESFARRLDILRLGLEKQKVTQEEFNQIVFDLTQKHVSAITALQKTEADKRADLMKGFESIVDAASNNILNGWKGMADGMKNAFSSAIQQMVAELVKSKLLSFFSSAFGGGIGKLLGGSTSSLPKLASGGQFTVGGKSGGDQNFVGFFGNRGETVTVTPRNESGPGGTNVNIYQTLDVKGASRSEFLAGAAALKEQTRAEVLDELRRSGLIR